MTSHLSSLTTLYNQLLDSTWERSKSLGKNKGKGYFKREQTMEKRYEIEKAEQIRVDDERTRIGIKMMEEFNNSK